MRYVKLELTWYTSAWLVVLSASARLAWVLLLGYCKGSGSSNKVKRLDALVASRMWFIGEEDVRQMEQAAINDGALVIEDGHWIVTNWAEYQDDSTNAERQRRFRDKKKDSDSNGSNALHNGVTVEERKGKERKDISSEIAREKGKPSALSEVTDFFWQYFPDRDVNECEKFWDHFTANGWKQGGRAPIKNWEAAFRNWMRRAGDFGGGK